MGIMGGEKYVTYFKKEEAENIRDGIAKELYSKMFNYLINELNKRMENNKDIISGCSQIAILDIFGFENFENNNSFEQLCINYANERLQHYFNDHVINLELEEYKNEGINIEKINYEDNKEIINFKTPYNFKLIIFLNILFSINISFVILSSLLKLFGKKVLLLIK